MFAIAVQPGQYRTYVLSDQAARSRLEVVPERGGMITRWQVQDQELLYLDRERFANPELTVRGGDSHPVSHLWQSARQYLSLSG